MKKLASLIMVVMLLCAVPAFAQTIIGPTENGNGSQNFGSNAQALSTGGTGIGYGGNSNASIYAPDYSYNPQSNYNNVYAPSNSSSSAGASNYNYSPSNSYSGASNWNYSPSNSSSGASSNVDNNINNRVRVNNDVNNTNVNINDPTFNNRNVIERGAVQNDNRNTQGQLQGQQQGQLQGQQQKMDQGQDQSQGQNNEQTIAPSQSTTIKIDAPKRPLPNIPSAGMPEQNFVNQSFYSYTVFLPDFLQVQLTPYEGEEVVKVLYTVKKVRYNELIPTLLNKRDKVLGKASIMKVRIIVLVQEGQRSWSIGSPTVIGGATASGMAGSSGLVGGMGETYANPRFTIHFVEIK